MKEKEPFKLKPWMIACFIGAILCLIFNIDFAGDMLEKIFGQDADKWAINITIVAALIYIFVKRR